MLIAIESGEDMTTVPRMSALGLGYWPGNPRSHPAYTQMAEEQLKRGSMDLEDQAKTQNRLRRKVMMGVATTISASGST